MEGEKKNHREKRCFLFTCGLFYFSVKKRRKKGEVLLFLPRRFENFQTLIFYLGFWLFLSFAGNLE